MIVAVGVAAWAAQRALLGDLDREVRAIAREDSAPGLDDLARSQRPLYDSCASLCRAISCSHAIAASHAGHTPRDRCRMPVTQLPRVKRRRSKLHGWGVFALEPINKNTRIIDYAGELIDHKESLKRETKYLKRGEIWCFTVNRRWVRDAHVGGNDARFINHACKPNCYSQIVGKTIWIRAGRNIEAGRRADLRLLHRRRADHPVPLPARVHAEAVNRGTREDLVGLKPEGTPRRAVMASGFRRTIRAVALLVFSVCLCSSRATAQTTSPTRSWKEPAMAGRFASAPSLADVSRPSRSRSTWRGCSLAKASRGPRMRRSRRSRSRSARSRSPTRVATGATASTCATPRTARCCARQRPPRGAQRWRRRAACSPTTGVRPKSFYSASCGGHSESASAMWPGADYPYLQAAEDDVHGRGSAVDRRVPVAPMCSRRCVVPASMVSGSRASRSRSGVRPGA